MTVTGNGPKQIWAQIAEAARIINGSRPSEQEVERVIKMLAETQRDCHPAYLVPVREGTHIDSVDDDDDDDDDDSDDDSDEEHSHGEMAAIENGNFSESESSAIHPTPVGARGIVGPYHQQQVHRRTPRPARTQVGIYENSRFRLVIDEEAPPTREFVVLMENHAIRRGQNRRVVAVMVEALKDDTFRNALLKATCDVLSCRNLPREGKKYFTPKVYEHTLPSGVREKMPQYKTVAHVPHSDAPMRFTHVPVGTEDSHAALANCTSDGGGIEADIQSMRQNHLYTELSEDETINSHFLMSHLRACDLPLTNLEYYLPEWSDDRIRKLTMAVYEENPQRYVFIHNYPESCAMREISKRKASQLLKDSPTDSRLGEFALQSKRIGSITHLAPAISNVPGVSVDPSTQKLVFSGSVSSADRQRIKALQNDFKDARKRVRTFHEAHQNSTDRYLGGPQGQLRDRLAQANTRQAFAQSRANVFSRFLEIHDPSLQSQAEGSSTRRKHALEPAPPSRRSSKKSKTRKGSKKRKRVVSDIESSSSRKRARYPTHRPDSQLGL
ncbi:MAG: hypothetical protein LC650_04295 [Actinobacteria bacterium]|nr:hypothetical protein [Actinomycetota bacterium]